MKIQGTPVLLATARRGHIHLALATFPRNKGSRARPGHAADREGAIAQALHRSRIFYAGPDVERDVLRAEARRTKVKLLLVNETLHLPSEAA